MQKKIKSFKSLFLTNPVEVDESVLLAKILYNLCTFVRWIRPKYQTEENKLKTMIEDKTPQRTSIAQLGRIWIDRPDKTSKSTNLQP
jgi:hypothetical protein